MQISSLKRACEGSRTARERSSLYVFSIASALLIPLLLLDLGLIFQLLVGRDSARLPSDYVLGPWVEGWFFEWPFFGDRQRCLLVLVAAGLGVSFLEASALWLLGRAVRRSALRSVAVLKEAIHRQVFRLGASDLLGAQRFRPERLFREESETVRQGLIRYWRAIPSSVVTLACLILVALAVNFWLTLLAVLLAGLVWQGYRGFRARAKARAGESHAEAAKYHAKLLEDLGLVSLTSGYSLDQVPGVHFGETLKQYEAAVLRAGTSEASVQPLLLLTILGSTSFLLLVVGLSPDASVAGCVVLGTALICAWFPATRLYRLPQKLAEAERAAEEIFAYLDREPGVRQVKDAEPLERLRREIKLENVTLADAEGKKLLDHVSLTIPAGTRVAVIASNAETPVALGGLFVRFHDPAAGRILFDDRDIHMATLDSVRGQVALVPRSGMLFSGTVTDNICCGDSGFTTLQVIDAAKAARAYSFIQELPQGFSTVIGEHGLQLSAGQAFRVALARALLRDPSLLLVEEPQAPLDEASTRHLDDALRLASPNRTVIVLATRLATLRAADRICLFHEGKPLADGKHAELLQNCELYRHLNYVRFNAFQHDVR